MYGRIHKRVIFPDKTLPKQRVRPKVFSFRTFPCCLTCIGQRGSLTAHPPRARHHGKEPEREEGRGQAGWAYSAYAAATPRRSNPACATIASATRRRCKKTRPNQAPSGRLGADPLYFRPSFLF